MERLLASGRTATLGVWVARATPDAPAVRLAEAELAFRDGRFYESETLATLAGRHLAGVSGFGSARISCGGQGGPRGLAGGGGEQSLRKSR